MSAAQNAVFHHGSFRLGTYLVADSASTAGRPLPEVVAAAVAGGVDMVQLRCKDVPARDFLALVLATARHTAGRAALIVNDRVDVFLAARDAGAVVDGMHIGQSDLPADAVRRLIGPAAILGLSASRTAQFEAVAALPEGTVSYLGTGAVRPTPTKKDHPEPLGFEGLAALTARAPLPCVAIGGLAHGDAAAVHAAGAAGMAIVRAVCAAGDPEAAARSLAAEWAAVTHPGEASA
ncbi:thiamine phosphate synthase [Zafaria sp. Z1313]|uniref:thiamine phosphate synthase n=1 Tax=unclassified Zafaria TaxID=2828765 RepID=UPI002E7A96DE|nr:thiamine phosphate synthase [Zafaria sp. J156]MEE1621433.1 thiamine phosphate synthase [Zafaria sp. J156]